MDPFADDWLFRPSETYRHWQQTEAAGADRRAFSPRSIIQHEAMFERFMRHLAAARKTLATFGPEHLESFFTDVDNRCQPGTTTRLRYQKLLDRLCRHLVNVGARKTNPAADFALAQAWPDDEPLPIFVPDADDVRLQAHVVKVEDLEGRALRNRAILALLSGAGITAQEIRLAKSAELDLSPIRPHIDVPKRGARTARRVAIAKFAVPALSRWHTQLAITEDGLLFPSPRTGRPMNDVLLGEVVRDELLANDIRLPDMSPRTLRNTYARRLLVSGHSNEEVSRLLGLTSQRTVVRLRATIPSPGEHP